MVQARIILFLIIFGTAISFAQDPSSSSNGRQVRMLFTAKDSTEAEFQFTAAIHFKGKIKPTLKKINSLVADELTYMHGPMGVAKYTAVPKDSGTFNITSVKSIGSADGLQIWEIEFNYKGTILLSNGPNDTYEVLLPISPNEIYSAGLINKGKSNESNPCTDPHYQSEGDFWYFWNPYQDGCNLKLGVDFQKIKGTIKRFKNTKLSYPEYSRLIEKNGILIVSLYGVSDPAEKRTKYDPNKYMDANAGNFLDDRNFLIKNGFEARALNTSEMQKLTGLKSEPNFYIEMLTKTVGKIKFTVFMFFGESGIDERSKGFHLMYKFALEKASIMIYGGHSGLGGHLDIESIEGSLGTHIRIPKDRYQIYFFNSCTSYTYYNDMYFQRKQSPKDPKGTKNLDIVTNGLATLFMAMPQSNQSVLKAVIEATEISSSSGSQVRVSYQQIADAADSDNLLGVNGDEDNPGTQY